MLHYLRIGLCITITQSHTHTMEQTRTHKAVTWRVEAKNYSLVKGNRSIEGQAPGRGPVGGASGSPKVLAIFKDQNQYSEAPNSFSQDFVSHSSISFCRP